MSSLVRSNRSKGLDSKQMIRRIFAWVFGSIYNWVQFPGRVLIACGVALFLGLVMDGTLLHIWMLQKEQQSLTEKIAGIRVSTQDVEKKLLRAQDPKFIKLQAQDRFDLASENELIFVFGLDEGEQSGVDL